MPAPGGTRGQRLQASLIATALVLAACGRVADAQPPAEPVKIATALDRPVLGFQFGKPLDRQIRPCGNSANKDQYRDYCVLTEGRSIGPKTKDASIKLLTPLPSSPDYPVPGWAQDVILGIGPSSEVRSLAVRTSGPSSQDAIIAAVTDRFGSPTWQQIEEAQNVYGARWIIKRTQWRVSDGVALFDCGRMDECELVIRTAAEQQRIDEVLRSSSRSNKL